MWATIMAWGKDVMMAPWYGLACHDRRPPSGFAYLPRRDFRKRERSLRSKTHDSSQGVCNWKGTRWFLALTNTGQHNSAEAPICQNPGTFLSIDGSSFFCHDFMHHILYLLQLRKCCNGMQHFSTFFYGSLDKGQTHMLCCTWKTK